VAELQVRPAAPSPPPRAVSPPVTPPTPPPTSRPKDVSAQELYDQAYALYKQRQYGVVAQRLKRGGLSKKERKRLEGKRK